MRIKSAIMEWVGRRIGLTDHKFWRAYYGGETWAGEAVNADTAMQVSAFWACVRLISQTIGTLPLGLYERRADGGRDAKSDHPLYKILHDQPSADHTAVEYWEGVVACLCLAGNAFSEKIMSDRRVVALELLRPDTMVVERTEAGTLRYRYTDRGKERIFSEDKIFHVRGFGMGGDVGLSPVAYARQSLSASRATERAAATLFANGLRPSGWLVYKGGTLSPEQRDQVKKNLIEPMSGAQNAGKTGILEAEFDYKQVTLSPEDGQMLETRQFGVEEVCRWLGVHPILIGHAGSGVPAWGTGIETLMIGWLTLGLRPYLVRIEQAIKRSLILPEERAKIYAEFNVEGLLRADSISKAALYSTYVQNGIFSRNKVRSLENETRDPSPLADALTVQSNLVPLDMLGEIAMAQATKPQSQQDMQSNQDTKPKLQVVK